MKIQNCGIVHRLVFCKDCDFDGDFTGEENPNNVLNRVKYHVKTTGHRIIVETGTIKTYSNPNDQ